jgi:hypothetical protein
MKDELPSRLSPLDWLEVERLIHAVNTADSAYSVAVAAVSCRGGSGPHRPRVAGATVAARRAVLEAARGRLSGLLGEMRQQWHREQAHRNRS